MIVVIDSIGSNLASLRFSLERIGACADFTHDVEKILSAKSVILPGVSTAGRAMEELTNAGLVNVIKKLTVPVLGICAGMQILFNSSEEEDVECLGIIQGVVKKLTATIVPHMGWNKVKVSVPNALIKEDGYSYFVHGYAAGAGSNTIASCTVDTNFSAAVQQENFYGVQFHPEKSGDFGENVLKNFLEIE